MTGHNYSKGTLQILGFLLMILGTAGPVAFSASLFPQAFKGELLIWITGLFEVPGAIVAFINFPKGPWPFGPRLYRQCLLVAMGWYVSATLLSETFAVLRHFQPSSGIDLPSSELLVWHAFLYAAWPSFIPLTRMCIFLRQLELKKQPAL